MRPSSTEAETPAGGVKVPPGGFSNGASCVLTAAEGASSGPFGLLPLEIQEGILLSPPATDLAPVELSSSFFRALVLDGELWRRKAETVGREALAVMNKEIDEMAEKVEEKRCAYPMHAYSSFRMEMKRKKAMEDELDSGDEDEESDYMENKVIKEKGSSENKPEANDNGDSAANNEDSEVNNEDSKEFLGRKNTDKMKEKESQPEKEDLTRYYTHNLFSNRQDSETMEVNCWLRSSTQLNSRMCKVCFGFFRELNRKYNTYDNNDNIEKWQGSIQTEIDKEVVRKEKLDELLAEPVGTGKEKMRAVLELLRDTPPFPSKYFDMAMEQGMPGKDS